MRVEINLPEWTVKTLEAMAKSGEHNGDTVQAICEDSVRSLAEGAVLWKSGNEDLGEIKALIDGMDEHDQRTVEKILLLITGYKHTGDPS